jgi:hypothetical protein
MKTDIVKTWDLFLLARNSKRTEAERIGDIMYLGFNEEQAKFIIESFAELPIVDWIRNEAYYENEYRVILKGDLK